MTSKDTSASKAESNQRAISRRSFLQLAGGAAGGLVLYACGPGSDVTTTVLQGSTTAAQGTTAAGDTVTVSWMVPPIFQFQFDGVTPLESAEQWAQQAAARFTEARDEIVVEADVIPWDVWDQRRAAALTQGPAPDLMYRLRPDVVNSGLVTPIGDLYGPATEAIKPAAVEALTQAGEIYGVPWLGNPAVLVFNRSLVEDAGALDLLPDSDTPRDLFWPQYLELMRAVHAHNGAFGLGVAAGHWSAVIGWALGGWLSLAGAETWETDSEERYVLHEQDATYQVLDTYVQMLDEELLVPGVPKWEDIDQLWYSEQLLTRGHWAAVDTELEVAVEAGNAARRFDLFYTQFPRAEGQPAAIDHNTDGNVFPTGADPASRQAAFDFANWLATDPEAAVGLAGNGFFPISTTGAEAARPVLSGRPEYQWILEHAIGLPAIPKWASGPQRNPDTIDAWARADIDNLYYAIWESIITGQRSPREGMEELGTRVNEAIRA